MGINHRRDDILAGDLRDRREREAFADATATVELFNERLAVGSTAWFWPTIGAALTSKHHWLIVACDSCDTVTELDLRVKRRDPEAWIRVALQDVRCSRCNGHGKPRIVALGKFASS